MKRLDIRGMRFGRLVAVTPPSKPYAPWGCLCDCGASVLADIRVLRSGNTKSCGCLQREAASVANTTHGLSRSATYNSWTNMIQRCVNPENPNYPDYGGRGITVCDRWRVFENFLADMGERPDGKTLERNDNNKGYEPDNCRWATWVEQGRNKRNTRWVTVDGVTMTLAEWARQLGEDAGSLRRRWVNEGVIQLSIEGERP